MHGTTALQRMPKGLVAALAMAGTLAAGIAGGFAARLAHLPLPWLLGSLFTIMALSLAGVPVRLVRWGRPAGTIVVGASTGLQFSASVFAKLVTRQDEVRLETIDAKILAAGWSAHNNKITNDYGKAYFRENRRWFGLGVALSFVALAAMVFAHPRGITRICVDLRE